MSDVFVSYVREDSALAERLVRELKESGFGVFSDTTVLVAGESCSDKTFKELRAAKVVLVLLSHNSRRSNWVDSALQPVLTSHGNVIPILLDSSATENWLWPLLADRQAIVQDSNADFGELSDRVIKVVRSAISASAIQRSSEAPMMRWSWWSWIIPLLTGLLGAIITWLLMM